MSLTLVFGADDPARVRFAISPLQETMSAVRVLQERSRHQYHLPWLESVRPELDRVDPWPLLTLSPHSGWTPDFLSPAPAGPQTDIAAQLAQVRATPAEQVAREVERSLTDRAGPPVPAAAWRLLNDPAATRSMLADMLERCWQLLIAPHWPRLRDLLDADVAYRTQILAGYGLERMLDDLDRRARWVGRAMVVDCPLTGEHQLGGAGLVLVPGVFLWPSLAAVIDPPAQPTLMYPARGIAELWQPAPTAHSAALAGLIGQTRAALLESLAEPAATHTLARRHALAASTVSEHLAILHNAGLVTRHRYRHAVLYHRTSLGAELADGKNANQRAMSGAAACHDNTRLLAR